MTHVSTVLLMQHIWVALEILKQMSFQEVPMLFCILRSKGVKSVKWGATEHFQQKSDTTEYVLE